MSLAFATWLAAWALLPEASAPAPARQEVSHSSPIDALPTLTQEPLLRVLIARGARIEITLERAVRLESPDLALELAPGPLLLEALPVGLRVSGGKERRELPSAVLLAGELPTFALDAVPVFGAPRPLRLSGDLVLHSERGEVWVIERVPMETYLASVVGAEMNPKWPAAALAAQAIVARSYATARWMERYEEPWQLHWHFGVDMAYHGWSANNESIAQAIAPTRGEMLILGGLPVLALFHASSGGRTESFERVKPGVLGPDGKTPIAAAMPIVKDDAALLGAAGLELSATHGLWKADIPLPEVTRGLVKWSADSSDRPPFGVVEAVSIAERHADSGRVARVSIRHLLEGKTRFTTILATDFRLAVSPVRIRSVWWDRCVIATKEPGYLVLQGRGFGHGCGLSQVSAWFMAKQGATPEEIVAAFYGARIERKY